MDAQDFWQTIDPPEPITLPYANFYPAAFDDQRILRLPIRPLPDGTHALASLIINQASFSVLDAIAADLAAKLVPLAPDVIIGLPTLGLTLAAAVAQKLGHGRYIPLGTSKKFWYRRELSVPLSSITTPDQPRRLYIDPRMVPLLHNRRIVLIDDVASTGTSMLAGITLLAALKLEPVALGVAMLQSDRWRAQLGDKWTPKMLATLRSPILAQTADGDWTA